MIPDCSICDPALGSSGGCCPRHGLDGLGGVSAGALLLTGSDGPIVKP
jgi:hypothetical protein